MTHADRTAPGQQVTGQHNLVSASNLFRILAAIDSNGHEGKELKLP
jgi:hypothetical protein